METITEKQIQYDPHRKDQIESIKTRIAELEEYKIELDNFYIKLQLELEEKGT